MEILTSPVYGGLTGPRPSLKENLDGIRSPLKDSLWLYQDSMNFRKKDYLLISIDIPKIDGGNSTLLLCSLTKKDSHYISNIANLFFKGIYRQEEREHFPSVCFQCSRIQ
ncbi:hypothetical protein AVEN_206049-1 [Araneus ventricosus]|uniref:Uncharacterized protein n=1 Tax=Araneus ventricosus TaxID=182803 RepID=A0A4Y2KCN7_ARAVE|nr:hypothetical protein AVEN_206049-1 [Araneus ventricosus]